MTKDRTTKKRLKKEAGRQNAQFKKEAEQHDFELFAYAYRDATGLTLECLDPSEAPDFICERDDGKTVGVELTQPIRSPDKKFWDEAIEEMDQMDVDDGIDFVNYMLEAKSDKVKNYSTSYNILVLQICEIDFGMLTRSLCDIPEEDFEKSGFDEIWLGDYNDVLDRLGRRNDAHQTINLFGLYPTEYQEHFRRPDWDAKPYG